MKKGTDHLIKILLHISPSIDHWELAWQLHHSRTILLNLGDCLLLLLLLLLHPFNSLLSRTAWVSQYQKGKTSLDLNEASHGGVLGCSGISWTICKQSAPRCRQITTPTPYHLIFTCQMLFLMPNQQCQSSEGIGMSGSTKSMNNSSNGGGVSGCSNTVLV